MADQLTPQQAQAVENRGGKLLVSAAAGSGKTKVLVDRLLRYLTDPNDPANLDDFLIITYTKAAASELRSKIASKLTEQIALQPENRHLQKQMQRLFLTKISTVHGFCADILREYAYRLDIAADFRVADENECRELRERVLTELLDRAYETAAENPNFRAFVDTQGVGRSDRQLPELIEKVYDSSRCHLNPDGWLEKCLTDGNPEGISDATQTVWGDFLIRDLQDYLNCQIAVLCQCAEGAEACPGLEKAAVTLKDALHQLEALRGMESWDEIAGHRELTFGTLRFPTKNNPDPELTEQIKAAWKACKDGVKKKLLPFANDSRQILADLEQSAAAARGLIALVRQFDRDYTAAKRSRRCLDFGDLEQKTLDLLLGKSRGNPTAAASEIGRRYREILVDEYQDSNGVQDAIFDALTREKQNCFLVGDVKQSIYQFRLADPGIFLKKYRQYVPAEDAEPGQGRKIMLSHNFRSGAEIIEAVNDVFRTCMRPRVGGLVYGEAEALREGIPHVPLESAVELDVIETRENQYPEEAAFVAERIAQMIREGTPVREGDKLRPVRPEDIVILLRSPGSAGGYFQQALEERGIRCASGGGTDLLQTEEIGTLHSLLQIIWNPRQDIPLISALASPIFGFTADELAQIRSRQKKGAFYDALLGSDLPKAQAFARTLDTLRRCARRNPLTVLLEQCLSMTRLDSVYAAMPGGEAKSENLRIFYQMAADFEQGNQKDLGQFLDFLDAMAEKGLPSAATSNAGCVTIMSIHKSKGLEFPVVFLSNLSRRFNRESQQAQILCDRDLGLGLSVADTENRVRYSSIAKRAIAGKMASESLSEELRVLYVAMTRARDRLIMTYADKNPEKILRDCALRQDFDNGELLCREAGCPGQWVLLAALRHTEAGALHALGGRPKETTLGPHPWRIQVVQAPEAAGGGELLQGDRSAMPEGVEQTLQNALSFQYPHLPATKSPSKQTATGRKGRVKDAEAAEDTQEPKCIQREFRRPSFLSGERSGKSYGSAIHAALQYLRYEKCGSVSSVEEEIQDLVDRRFLTPEQGAMVDCGKIAAFFQTDIGRKLRSGSPCLREFKFSILDDGRNYGDGLEGERVLLQGVVDCALLEPDGITVLDFKTDHVTEETVVAAAERYRLQVQTYGDALSRIYEMPIKRKLLYFFQLDRFVEV
ncbi:MAG: helicase-exonuclease AddAB subunit AddA [Firmicutes bacterium]|nr:helicase-exonuclease AddAB subunit AddA [Bacillota bacterium]